MLSKIIASRSIGSEESLISALKLMDQAKVKSLLVFEDGLFVNIVSIGDIQRAIIKNTPLTSPINGVLRKDATLAHSSDSREDLIKLMKDQRIEMMPILGKDGSIEDVLTWETISGQKSFPKFSNLNLPVVIMAGGKGTRLRPITNILPKPLIPLGTKTILEHIMDSFVHVGCNEFHLSVNYKAELIEYYFSELNNSDYKINYFTEPKPLGTVGSIALLKGKLNTTFFISNCDILIEQDYSEVLSYHREQKNEITIVAAIKHYNIPYGTLITGKNGQLMSLKEKPEITYKINSGLYILEPHLIDEVPEGKFYHITHLIEDILNRQGKVGVFPISEGAWQDIGQWDQYLSKKDDY